MKYIFNADGKCVASCSYEPSTDDLDTRNETAVASETVYQLSEIQLVGGVITAIVETLDQAKTRYITAAKAYRDAQEVAPVTFNGNTYDYDAKARERLLIARTAIEDTGSTGTIEWTLAADQSRVIIGLDDFKGITATAAVKSNTLHVNYTTTKAALLAATTVEELETIYPLGV